MTLKNYFNNLLECDIVVSDSEIENLARLSNKTDAIIKEQYDNGKYYMSIKFKDMTKNNEEEVLFLSEDKDKYREFSTDFFKKFIKYGGNIDLKDIFID